MRSGRTTHREGRWFVEFYDFRLLNVMDGGSEIWATLWSISMTDAESNRTVNGSISAVSAITTLSLSLACFLFF